MLSRSVSRALVLGVAASLIAAPSASAQPKVTAPDACTFFAQEELEKAVGWQLRLKKKDAPPGTSICDFSVPPGMSITKTFPNPPLPASVGFSSLVINTHPADAKLFADFRRTLGQQAEDVPNVGDGAYFYGPNLIYVRVGTRGFSVRMYFDPRTDADRAKAREVMLALAKAGAKKLS